MKAWIEIFYKPGVFDPQGSTTQSSLKRLGFQTVENVRIGKIVELELSSQTEDEAREEIEQMCKKLLVNPVIEAFHIREISEGNKA